MEVLQLKIWFICLIVFVDGFILKKRLKRYKTPPPPTIQPELGLSIEAFASILNDSVPSTCQGTRHKMRRRFSLSADSLQSMLVEKGGVFIPELMAVEDDSAQNFKSLLNLGTFQNEEEIDHHFRSTDYPVSKNQLEADLRKWNYITDYLKSANNTLSATSKLHSEGNYLHNTSVTSTSKLASSVTRHSSAEFAISHTISEFLLHSNITLTQLIDYVKSMKIRTNPKILMGLQNRTKRKKRNSDGSTSITQYCMKKGSPTKNNFLSLCGECAVTTKLPADRFPRILNEAVCGNDRTCISLNGHPQGACLPVEVHLTFLRRRPGSCRMLIKTNEEVDVDEWEPYTQTVRTGCSCSIDKRSYLANHLGFHAPVVG